MADQPAAQAPPKGRMKRWVKWLLWFLAIAIVGIVLASFHQPPMRLMPAPLLFQKAGPGLFAPLPAEGSRIELFYATNRLPVGPRNARLYAVAPGRNLSLGIATVGIGTGDLTLGDILAFSTANIDGRRPQLPLLNMTEFGAVEEEKPLGPGERAWLSELRRAIAASRDRDIIIYVHGANSTVERAAGQAAQLMHFTGRHSTVILFAWPTAENFLRYSSDIETAFGAAPQLARLVGLLARETPARRIDLLSYSAGGTVASEGLALVGRAGGTAARLGDIIHAAPDADFTDFVDDLRDYAPVTKRISVYANMGDAALRLSQTINRGSRAGRPDWAELSGGDTRFLLEAVDRHGLQLIRIRPENIPGTGARSHVFWYDDPWVSSDVILTFLFSADPPERGLVEGAASTGKPYWQFPADYPARLEAALPPLSARIPPGPGTPSPAPAPPAPAAASSG